MSETYLLLVPENWEPGRSVEGVGDGVGHWAKGHIQNGGARRRGQQGFKAKISTLLKLCGHQKHGDSLSAVSKSTIKSQPLDFCAIYDCAYL